MQCGKLGKKNLMFENALTYIYTKILYFSESVYNLISLYVGATNFSYTALILDKLTFYKMLKGAQALGKVRTFFLLCYPMCSHTMALVT